MSWMAQKNTKSRVSPPTSGNSPTRMKSFTLRKMYLR